MKKTEIELIQTSFLKVAPMPDRAAKVFYEKLFELEPNLKVLFKGDMVLQGRKLVATLRFVNDNLKNLSSLTPELQEMGRRHIEYGVADDHYEHVGTALIQMFEELLADEFNEETKNAWIKLYTVLSISMKEAALRPLSSKSQ